MGGPPARVAHLGDRGPRVRGCGCRGGAGGGRGRGLRGRVLAPGTGRGDVGSDRGGRSSGGASAGAEGEAEGRGPGRGAAVKFRRRG